MDVFEQMVDRWPSAIVARRDVEKFTGGMVKSKFLANQDSLGTGPDDRIEIAGRIGYPIESLIIWLRARSSRKG